jgi:hypothetical protein
MAATTHPVDPERSGLDRPLFDFVGKRALLSL